MTTDELPTARTTLRTGYVRVLVFCRSCRYQADANLQAISTCFVTCAARRNGVRLVSCCQHLEPRVCNPGRRHQIDRWPAAREDLSVGRNRAQVVAVTIATILMIAPAVAETPLDLSTDPPKAGPSLSLGRVGPDLCPGCRTERSGVYNFITQKGPRPIEPVPGILLSLSLIHI